VAILFSKSCGYNPPAFILLEEKILKHANWRGGRFVAIALIGSFFLGLAPSTLAADEAAPGMSPKPALTEVASAKVASLGNDALSLAAVQAATPSPGPAGGGFFKTGKGRAAVILFVAAAGLTVYSKYHDRVKSGIR